MSEWQPIETAPKDGTPFLAQMKLNQDLSPIILHWEKLRGIWVVTWDSTDITQAWGDEPTHWQPLPAPPTIKPETEGV